MTTPNPELPTILVIGDIVCDCFTYRDKPDSGAAARRHGTQMIETLGGANLPFSILRSVAEQRPKALDLAAKQAAEAAKKAKKSPEEIERASGDASNARASACPQFQVRFGLKVEPGQVREIPPSLWTYALCSPAPYDRDKKGKKDRKVWRVGEPLGYGALGDGEVRQEWADQDALTNPPAVAILDDGDLGFRRKAAEYTWPAWLKKPNEVGRAPWIVLKTIHPITTSDLWRAVVADPALARRTVVVAAAEDLRKGEIHVSSGISWERTATDLVKELCENPTLLALRKVAFVVISLGAAGALFADHTGDTPRYRLIFDPANLEGDVESKIEGLAFGRLSSMSASIAAQLIGCLSGSRTQTSAEQAAAPTASFIERGIHAGLRGLRALLHAGYGSTDSTAAPGFPVLEIAKAIDLDISKGVEPPAIVFSTADVPVLPAPDWKLLRCSVCGPPSQPRAMSSSAMMVALRGLGALRHVPYQQYGAVTTVDRDEIEDLRVLKRLMDDYASKASGSKPLSLAVFGAPGSGKSFLVKQLAKASGRSNDEAIEFNLSQFTTPEELHGPLHQVRDLALKGKLPLVFWDEFDARNYEWLQHFLMPMQDGTFQEGQITHPIGKCVFVFAGGTSRQYQEFGERVRAPEAKGKKGPDFLSRLHGYLNVIGPNPRERFSEQTKRWEPDGCDACSPLRRAILLRSLLGLEADQVLRIDRGVLRALLEVPSYKHGARSMQQLLELIKQRSRTGVLRRSDLPPRALMNLMVDQDKFFAIVTKDDAFKREAEPLAPVIHAYYDQQSQTSPTPGMYVGPFDDLPPDIKDDNIAAAMRIPDVLSLAQLQLVPKGDQRPTLSEADAAAIIDDHIEILAEAEHDGWMDFRLLNGWKHGLHRENANRIHPALIPYAQLSEADKDKDRAAVRKYPELARRAGYAIARGGERTHGSSEARK